MQLGLLLGAPLVFFGLVEGILRLAEFGKCQDFFIPDEDKPGFYCANPGFTDLFLPAHFGIRPLNIRLKKQKEPDSIRLFVLGESAVQGTPDPAFSFAAQLQAQLSAHYRGKKVEVHNLGIAAINSHVVYQIARQLPDFEPDLLVVYMGNNEVIGPYGPGSAYLSKMPPLWAIRASVWARGTRTGQLLLRFGARFNRTEARAMEWRGMNTFMRNAVRGNDPRLAAVEANFERNLRDIVGLAAQSGIKTVLSTVVANLKDCSPFLSLHPTTLTPPELAAWEAAQSGGMLAWSLAETDQARALFTEALRLDPEYADTHFMLGRLAETQGDLPAARRHYLDALRWDSLRFRPDPRLNDIIRKVAGESGPAVQIVDAARILGADAATDAPLSGHEFLFEHVHLNWDGNARLAGLLAAACAPLLPPAPAQAGWLSAAECAEQLGYVDYCRLNILKSIVELTDKPPFTNQLTYGELQARLKTEIKQLSSRVMSREGLLLAKEKLSRALQLNPEDANLLVRLGNLEFETRDYQQALELLEKAMALKPRLAVLVTQKANLLQLLHRPNEAEELLVAATRADPYYFPAWQVLIGLWGRQGQLNKSRRALETLLEQMPSSSAVRLAYADLLTHQGETAAAEQEWLAVLHNDPTNTTALEKLVRAYAQKGRTADAEALMLKFSKSQPRNYDNNVRLAQIYAARRDSGNMVVYLRALTESGRADASLHLELAQRLVDLNREREALVYARRGKLAATTEGNTLLGRAADELLAQLTPR